MYWICCTIAADTTNLMVPILAFHYISSSYIREDGGGADTYKGEVTNHIYTLQLMQDTEIWRSGPNFWWTLDIS